MNIQSPLPLELQKSEEKLQKADARSIAKFGHGASTKGWAITRECVPILAELIRERLDVDLATLRSDGPTSAFLGLLKGLPCELVALCCLQNVLHSIGQGHVHRDTMLLLATQISAECWAAKLTLDNPRLAARIEKAVRARHSSAKQRRQAVRSAASRAGYKQKNWSVCEKIRAGNWLSQVTRDALPFMFELVLREDGQAMMTITDGAMDIAAEAVREAVMRNPVLQPTEEKPAPWTSQRMFPKGRESFNITFVRTIYRETSAAVSAAIKSGQMKPALDAVNALQSVPWTINHRVHEVMKECFARKINIPKVPPFKDLPKPAYPKPWEDMTPEERSLWKLRASEAKSRNRGFTSDRVLLAEDMATAERVAEWDRFYTPMNCDWRGRVYGLSHFNFQREDRVRSLFKFADGEPIGEDGLWWLKVHTANCGDFDKISKRPMLERVRWCEVNEHMIRDVARDPIGTVETWKNADKPFLFVAACIELTEALENGPTFVTTLPVSWDGSCSGLQHLCAMTRASEGSLVNLTPGTLPQDVYATVAAVVKSRVAADDSPLARAWLAFGIDRKIVKRNVMTYSYSSKKFGMSGQQDEDLIIPLKHKVIDGALEEHPFSLWAQKPHRDAPSPAAVFIAKHTFAGIEEIVTKPAEAMAFLQKLARTMAHESKPVSWTTPTGIPWSNRYHEPDISRVRLWMHDQGVTTKTLVKLCVGMKREIDKNRSANGVAPNFVHALDAAHLMLTVNAAVAEGIVAQATVHDSFGCLASRAKRYNEIIREQFVAMYETHDVLSEVLERAKCDLTQHNWERLPDVPAKGPLNLREVLNAEYAFA
jgi:DNA-directed RNA polymerase